MVAMLPPPQQLHCMSKASLYGAVELEAWEACRARLLATVLAVVVVRGGDNDRCCVRAVGECRDCRLCPALAPAWVCGIRGTVAAPAGGAAGGGIGSAPPVVGSWHAVGLEPFI
eukprot:SAG31_NODE_3844_length_3822_cov_1.533978_4_plen_114_part_00